MAAPPSMTLDTYKAIAERLRTRVLDSLDERPAAWLAECLSELSDGVAPARLLAIHAGAARRVRGCSLKADERLVAEAAAVGLPGLVNWDLARSARAVLLREALDGVAIGQQVELVRALYRGGDNAEREALLGALLLLPRPERFVGLAVDACRSNVEDVFAAIACENAFPALHFPDASFNQMVMKAVFLGLPLARVCGLTDRASAELARMADDFANERRAAGRSIPADLDLISSIPGGRAAGGDIS